MSNMNSLVVELGHGGVQRTLRLKAKKKVWPGMKEAVKTFQKIALVAKRCLR